MLFVSEEQRRMFDMDQTRQGWRHDNRTVYRKLKAFLIDSPAWAWIEPFDIQEDGRAAFFAWIDHYNGQGELSKRTALAKTKLKSLHYKKETSMSFERYTELMSKCFQTLDKDKGQLKTPR